MDGRGSLPLWVAGGGGASLLILVLICLTKCLLGRKREIIQPSTEVYLVPQIEVRTEGGKKFSDTMLRVCPVCGAQVHLPGELEREQEALELPRTLSSFTPRLEHKVGGRSPWSTLLPSRPHTRVKHPPYRCRSSLR